MGELGEVSLQRANEALTKANEVSSALAELVQEIDDLEAGAVTTDIQDISTDTTITLTSDKLVRCNATSANITVTLPAASGVEGKKAAIKKTDSSVHTIIIDAYEGELINGATTLVISYQNSTAMLVSNGTSWDVI